MFGMVLEPSGWLTYKKIHKALMFEEGFRHLTPVTLRQFFHLYRPEGFEWKDTMARALPAEQSPDLHDHTEIVPEDDLFIAVRPRSHRHVLESGMNSRGRDWIILSRTREMAVRIGKMNAQNPVIGTLKVERALQQGAKFYKAGKLLVLTRYVRPGWLQMPPLPREKTGGHEKEPTSAEEAGRTAAKNVKRRAPLEREPSKGIEQQTAGAFFMTPDDFFGLVDKGAGRGRRRSKNKGARRGAKRKKDKNR